jgi:hypothetical protein
MVMMTRPAESPLTIYSLSADSKSHLHPQLITAHLNTATSSNHHAVQHILSVIDQLAIFFTRYGLTVWYELRLISVHRTVPPAVLRRCPVAGHFRTQDCAPAVLRRHPVAGHFRTQHRTVPLPCSGDTLLLVISARRTVPLPCSGDTLLLAFKLSTADLREISRGSRKNPNSQFTPAAFLFLTNSEHDLHKKSLTFKGRPRRPTSGHTPCS